jgi:hypothetical protein
MVRDASTVVDSVRAKAVSTSGYLRRIESARGSGAITENDAEQAYRGAFLSFHSQIENSLEILFVGLLRGRISHRLASVRPLLSIPSDVVASRVVFAGRSYADWLPYSRHTLERSKLYFAAGRPFTLLAKEDRKLLDALSLLRNALAHESTHALRQFRREFVEGKALPPAQRRPAGYLRGFHALGQRRFEFLTARATSTLQRLV